MSIKSLFFFFEEIPFIENFHRKSVYYGGVFRTRKFFQEEEGGLCRMHNIVSRAHDKIFRAYDIISRAHDTLSPAHNLLYRVHEIICRAHDIIFSEKKFEIF